MSYYDIVQCPCRQWFETDLDRADHIRQDHLDQLACLMKTCQEWFEDFEEWVEHCQGHGLEFKKAFLVDRRAYYKEHQKAPVTPQARQYLLHLVKQAEQFSAAH